MTQSLSVLQFNVPLIKTHACELLPTLGAHTPVKLSPPREGCVPMCKLKKITISTEYTIFIFN